MNDIIKTLAGTPIPTILVVAGVLFLFMSVAEKFSGQITIPKTRKKQALILGLVLLVAGIGLTVTPTVTPTAPVTQAGVAATPTPTAAVVASDVAKVNWEELSWTGMTSGQRGLWSELGWTAESWAETTAAPVSYDKSFSELTANEQDAAKRLGFSQIEWDAR